jgi:hypothetical protein
MGAAIDTGGGDKKSVNVDLNIVPYIDLMSCLTACPSRLSPSKSNTDQESPI